MSAIGSLIFCTVCGNLLQESTGDTNAILFCDICGARNKGQSTRFMAYSRDVQHADRPVLDTMPMTIISESKPSDFPSALRAKRSAVQTLTTEDKKTEAVTQHTCARCGRQEMYFTTVQLRSADEGSTVFFSCVCGHKYASFPFLCSIDIHGANYDFQLQGNPRQLDSKGPVIVLNSRFYIYGTTNERRNNITKFLLANLIKQRARQRQRKLLRLAPTHTPSPRSFHTQPCQEPPKCCPSPLAPGHSQTSSRSPRRH